MSKAKLRSLHLPQGGFTAIEIIFLVIVVGILSSLAVRPLKGFVQRIRLQNGADGMKHLILNARIRATGNALLHCGVALRPHDYPVPDSVFCFFDRSVPPDNDYDKGTDSLYLNPLILPNFPGIQLTIPTGSPTDFVFRGDGSANLSAKAVLTLGVMQDSLDVLASTGRVRVKAK